MTAFPPDEADLQRFLDALPGPVLIVDTIVGKGNVTVGEALKERLPATMVTRQVSIEDHLPASAVNEDLSRYRFISNRIPWLLNLIYRFPLIYWRKKAREQLAGARSLGALRRLIEETGARSVLAISHRPTFWLSSLKRSTGMPFRLYGVQTEFGPTVAWRYLFWEALNGFVSPLPAAALPYPFPENFPIIETPPLARRRFHDMRAVRGDPNEVLLIAGYWGQISRRRAISAIRDVLEQGPGVRLTMICGTNERLREALAARFASEPRVRFLGCVDAIDEHLRRSAIVLTKPGFSTIVETWAAGRTLLLLPGMPVAEDHNARFATEALGAHWFSVGRMRSALASMRARTAT